MENALLIFTWRLLLVIYVYLFSQTDGCYELWEFPFIKDAPKYPLLKDAINVALSTDIVVSFIHLEIFLSKNDFNWRPLQLKMW